jgi:hypothetical protein
MPTSSLDAPIFLDIRTAALTHWLTATGRELDDALGDVFTNALECKWQLRCESQTASAVLADSKFLHSALFCGIGESGSFITDALTDTRADAVKLNDANNSRRLFRHYCRLMFSVAELLSDFEVALSTAHDKRAVRDKLGEGVQNLHAFVNRVVKHKARALHHHDHHLPIEFADGTDTAFSNAIQMSTRNLVASGSFDCIVAPKLVDILDVAICAYRKFDELIVGDDVFNRLLPNYSAVLDTGNA